MNDMSKTPFPEQFKIMVQDLLGDESENLLVALETPPETSVRLNKRKPGATFPGAIQVKWCESGFYLSERPEFILDPLLHAGAYYVQDASSMIYETVIAKLVDALIKDSDTSALKVLDLCAAPGGKTTAMINALPNGSSVVANEYSQKRVGVLRENLIKWGYPDVTVTNRDSSFYANQGAIFDIVAVDAPCSGEGMMRKDMFAREQWSLELVRQCSSLQKEILANAVKALKPGGFLIYSTCTFNRHENEENVEYAVKELGLLPFDPEFPNDWNIPAGIDTEYPVSRFMPHKTRGEGLFIAVFKKEGVGKYDKKLEERKIKIKNDSEIPELENILAYNFDKSKYPTVELDQKQALTYLRRESFSLPQDKPKGLIIVTYKGLPLGPAKNIGSRVNNLYPKQWRILKR